MSCRCHKIMTMKTFDSSNKNLLAIEKYKKSEASIERAVRIAGVSISKMMDVFREHGVEANIEFEDYLKGLETLRRIW